MIKAEVTLKMSKARADLLGRLKPLQPVQAAFIESEPCLGLDEV
jgi:hypothetical protein